MDRYTGRKDITKIIFEKGLNTTNQLSAIVFAWEITEAMTQLYNLLLNNKKEIFKLKDEKKKCLNLASKFEINS